MTMEARVLYGLLLDRMSLSARNGWLDDRGRVFLYFTLEDAMAQMGFGHNKAVRHFKELEEIGLIERRKQGQGKPTRIYVKNFILPSETGQAAPPERRRTGRERQSDRMDRMDAYREVIRENMTNSTGTEEANAPVLSIAVKVYPQAKRNENDKLYN